MVVAQPWEWTPTDGCRLWQWVGRDHDGNEREYQTETPQACCKEEALEVLQRHFRNLTIINIEPIRDGRRKPPKGLIEAHSYDFGIMRKLREQKLIESVGPEEWRRLRERHAIARRPLPQPLRRHS